MKFTIKDKNYTVNFSYSGTTTTAELIELEAVGDSYYYNNTNIIGIARLYYKDKVYSKVKGRKVALAKLLKRMNEPSAGEKKSPFKLTKKMRTKIWEEYFKTHRKG